MKEVQSKFPTSPAANGKQTSHLELFPKGIVVKPRERILAVLNGQIPDCVPVCPDISNMVSCRLTGKPYWDIYLKDDPPLWKAHIDALKYFDLDGGFELYRFPDPLGDDPVTETRILKREKDRIITRDFYPEVNQWDKYLWVYHKNAAPAAYVKPETVDLPDIPDQFDYMEEVIPWPDGMELWRTIKREIGDQGVLGMPSGMVTCLLNTVDDVYDYYDNPSRYRKKSEAMLENTLKRIDRIAAFPKQDQPDFLVCGASGSLVLQTVEIFTELILPVLKEVTKAAKKIGIPTHVHSCGPEKEIVRIAVEETDLTIIDPLEIAPMGDCNLADLKKQYGQKIILKGNLHTTDIMLHGTVQQVKDASKKAIDDAAEGGGFILSTGDQCGRDTPDENIHVMVETARTYGKY